MRKAELLNSRLLYIVSSAGHGQSICIADAGLPIPSNVEKIDLALVPGVPSFFQVLNAILSEFAVEKATLASELVSLSPDNAKSIEKILSGVDITYTSHEEFKKQTESCLAIIRTGEFSPYMNVILTAGVVF